MTKLINEKTAVDDRRHSGTADAGRAVVNMAIAMLHASSYRVCSEEAVKLNIEAPSYSWFLLHF